jgi:hypothetical protein
MCIIPGLTRPSAPAQSIAGALRLRTGDPEAVSFFGTAAVVFVGSAVALAIRVDRRFSSSQNVRLTR